MVQNFASSVASQPCSDSWVNRFLHRHRDQLTSQWATGMDSNRHNAESAYKYKLYFKLLQQKITQYKLEPEHTYNMDEKGFAIGVLGRSKRVFSRRQYEKKEVRQARQDGSREWVSLLATICADGTALPPGIIFASKNSTIQSRWVADIHPGKHSVHVASSPSGWTNNEIGLAWLEQVFDRYTKPKARLKYRLLIVNGHGSHLTQSFIEYCHQKRIILAVLPPHSTQTLQPLDVVCFKPLSSNYASELDNYLQASQGLAPLSKGDFHALFWPAWVNTFKEDLILKAFTATGISPIDPNVILDRFRHTTPDDLRSVSSSSTAYSAEDWLKACTTLHAEVKNHRSVGARKLGQTIHHLSTQVELLSTELDALRKKLYQTRKRQKQPNRQLDLQQHQEYHGGAMMWSPRSFREARARMSVADHERQEEELKKAEKKDSAAANKLFNEKLKEEKRAAAAKAKEVRERERAEERAAIDARKEQRRKDKEARNTAKALKVPQRGNCTTSKASAVKQKPARRAVGARSHPKSATPPLPRATVTTRSGRTATRYQ
ncbi:putative pogo transposable element [Didymella exigua CBS 183.55]|uniref:Putative pogo transposable element n=1 Tax=Didymella exigua CBS 183.55 TaxID=1150837 RepID=A0A6A5S762_9PLEO|nr:putative pogo transposable element [Didymella exigua CBS 183.55]KAF1933347.1 putative pogo transposable element [Didymella exigua CBS 183.55]